MNGRHCWFGEQGAAECVPGHCGRPEVEDDDGAPCLPLPKPCPWGTCAYGEAFVTVGRNDARELVLRSELAELLRAALPSLVQVRDALVSDDEVGTWRADAFDALDRAFDGIDSALRSLDGAEDEAAG